MDQETEALLARVNPEDIELLSLWADALVQVGGVYAAMDADGLRALARGTATLMRTLLDGGVLNEAVAGRYVSPPPYREQPPSEFLRATMAVQDTIAPWLRAKAPSVEVGERAVARVRAVLADATVTVLRMREHHGGPLHLVTVLGALFGRVGGPRATFAQAADRIATEFGAELCLIGTLDAEHLRLYAVSQAGTSFGCLAGDVLVRASLPWLDFVETEHGWSRTLRPEDPGLEGQLARHGLARLVAHPLLSVGRVVGLVAVATRGTPRSRWSDGLRVAAPLLAAHLAHARQMGALEQAEAALSEAYDAAPTMMCATDRLGRVIRTSRRFRDDLGLPDDCVGMPLQWLVHPAWMDRFGALWQRIHGGEGVEPSRVDFITAHGTRLPVSVEAHWVRDELGDPAVCMLVFWNVASMVAREQAQRARIDELDAFAHQVAHDLKAPLRTIVGFANVLRDDLVPGASEEHVHWLDRIRSAAERGDAMVEGILRFAKSGGAGHHEPVRASVLLGRARGALAADIEARGADIVLVRDDTSLLGDTEALATLLTNLIGNALRYTEGDGPRVEVSVTALNSGWAALAVRDFGIGIAPEDQGRIFELFQRAAGDRPGTGVGLTIVRRVARAHGGDVEVTSTPGQGSMFSVRLPTA